MSDLTPDEIAYRQRMVEKMKARHPMPALLSAFLPGVGQAMKGSIGKAALIWVGVFVNIALMTVVVGFVTGPLFWLWNVVDAYREPEA